MRIVVALALLLVSASAASAQPAGCVDTTASWTTPYSQGSIQAITYFVWHPAPPPPSQRPPLLAVLYRSGDFHIHINVPQGVAQQFTKLTSADQKYAQLVQNHYQQALLAQDGCPLLNSDDTYLLGQQP